MAGPICETRPPTKFSRGKFFPDHTRVHNFATVPPVSWAFINLQMGSPGKMQRAQWDDTKDWFLIKFLQKATREGKKSDSGFKQNVWNALTTQFNLKFGPRPPYKAKQIQTRMHTVNSKICSWSSDVLVEQELQIFSHVARTKWLQLGWQEEESNCVWGSLGGLYCCELILDAQLKRIETSECKTIQKGTAGTLWRSQWNFWKRLVHWTLCRKHTDSDRYVQFSEAYHIN